MRKFPDPKAPDSGTGEGSEEATRLSLQRADDASPRTRPRVSRQADADHEHPSHSGHERRSRSDDEKLRELELRLREWVERADTLEAELRYLKRDLEVRIAYTRELERHLEVVAYAERELAAVRARAAYRIVDGIVARVEKQPALHRFGRTWTRRIVAWRDR